MNGKLKKTPAVYKRTHFHAERKARADPVGLVERLLEAPRGLSERGMKLLPPLHKGCLDSATHSPIINPRIRRKKRDSVSGSPNRRPGGAPEGNRFEARVGRPFPEGPVGNKIQIVQMNATNALPDKGGIATYAHELAFHLTLCGHEPALVTYPCEVPVPEPQSLPYPVFRTPGFDLRRLAARKDRRTSVLLRLPFAVLAMARETLRVIRSLPSGRPKILWPVQWWPESLAAWLVSRASRIPYCVTAHGFEAVIPPTMRRNRLYRGIMNRAAAVFAVSRHTASLLARCGVRDEKIRVIPNGVRPEAFARTSVVDHRIRSLKANLGLEGAYVLLTVSRLARRKGHLVALDAVAALRNRIPALRYVVAGDGPMLGAIRNRIAALGLEDIVRVLGSVLEQDKVALLHGCDVFVMPNEDLPLEGGGVDTEGFGLVFLEAAACGKPAVGGRAGGVPEAVVDGETGILVRPGDPREVEQAVLRLWEDRGLAGRMGRAGQERVRKDFSWSRIALRYAETFEALLCSR